MSTRLPLLTRFVASQPRYSITQAKSLDWLVAAHTEAETTLQQFDPRDRERFAIRMRAAINRCACPPEKLGTRHHSVDDLDSLDFLDNVIYDVRRNPRGKTSHARTQLFAKIVDAYFEKTYADEATPPDDVIHVTCTGYISPNGAQKLVARRGWGAITRVTNAYQMGCYASLPAVRIAAGFAATGARRVDLVHTELCSLHLDPTDHRLEQLVVQSLFADGLIRYSMVPGDDAARGLRVLAQHECVLPDSAAAMTWLVGDAGMQMTLARDVPERIGGALRGFITDLLGKAGRKVSDLKGSVFAVHPGGPRIIDRVQELLELADPQLAASRGVLFDHGNMSSATLPHIWKRLFDDPRIAPGTLIPSLAFGPGLTICGGLLEKC